ncbi:Hypothetical protein I596_3563 [Dokdonella koreensis DS-123]|uniref:Uncharacterized protein n=1 Tax=Dokdonella koreensis DS-123 TaxID=1300342 RepID=A0A160DYN0_9GAMM|nr:Hypothetical protein I596_3563 [Dokdonella koreensis DS-123]
MQIEQHQKCAHAPCTCQVPIGTEYCSDHCREHASKVGDSCACGHRGCSKPADSAV